MIGKPLPSNVDLGHRPLAEINVTPFVDVMLVLLVVFMVTAPMLAAGVKIDLPSAPRLPPVGTSEAPLIVSLRADGGLFLGDVATSLDDLRAAVAARVAARPEAVAHLRADASVPYARVLQAMAVLGEAGAARIAFIGKAGPAAGAAP